MGRESYGGGVGGHDGWLVGGWWIRGILGEAGKAGEA